VFGWGESWALSEDQPAFEGKVLTEWTRDLKSKRPEVRLAAARALGNMGPKAKDAVPALCRALKDRHAGVRESVARALGEIRSKAAVPALLEVITYKYYDDPGWAIWALGRIGPEGKAAIPALVDIYFHDKSWCVQAYTKDALVGMGEAVVPALLQILDEEKDEDDWGRRWRAVGLLGCLGPKAKDAVPALLGCLKDSHAPVRECAVISLGRIGPMAKDAVPALIQILRDRGGLLDNAKTIESRRGDAAEALGNIGPEAKSAIPDLMKGLKDKSPAIRSRAAEALRNIDPQEAAKAGVR
jgi:HEAT repeat protein